MTNSSFIDLTPEMYPFTMYYVNHLTGAIVCSERVTGPGAVSVPGSSGFPVGVYIVTPQGASYGPPPGYESERSPRGLKKVQDA